MYIFIADNNLKMSDTTTAIGIKQLVESSHLVFEKLYIPVLSHASIYVFNYIFHEYGWILVKSD